MDEESERLIRRAIAHLVSVLADEVDWDEFDLIRARACIDIVIRKEYGE